MYRPVANAGVNTPCELLTGFILTPSQNTLQLAAGMNGRRKNPSCGVYTSQEGVGDSFLELGAMNFWSIIFTISVTCIHANDHTQTPTT